MVLKESLRRRGLVEVHMEFGQTKYLMLSLDKKEPRWPAWPRQRGRATVLPWCLSWLKQAAQGPPVTQGGPPSALTVPMARAGSRQPAAEPTPNSAATKDEKHFLSGGIALSCVFTSPAWQNVGDKAQTGYKRRHLVSGIGLV